MLARPQIPLTCAVSTPIPQRTQQFHFPLSPSQPKVEQLKIRVSNVLRRLIRQNGMR